MKIDKIKIHRCVQRTVERFILHFDIQALNYMKKLISEDYFNMQINSLVKYKASENIKFLRLKIIQVFTKFMKEEFDAKTNTTKPKRIHHLKIHRRRCRTYNDR